MSKKSKGTTIEGTDQLLVLADDINLLVQNINIIKEKHISSIRG